MIGISCRYRKLDGTLAALALAGRLAVTGKKFSIRADGWRLGDVDPAYDNKLADAAFVNWAKKCSHIVWTHPAGQYELDVLFDLNIKSTLWAGMDQLADADWLMLDDYEHILLPTSAQAVAARDELKLPHVAVQPYDPGLPITRKPGVAKPGQVALFMSLYGQQRDRVDLQSIWILADLAKKHPEVTVTIATDKRLTPRTAAELEATGELLGSRWNVPKHCPWRDQVWMMGQHDLVVWPARLDGFGIIPVTAMNLGVPLIGWDVSPMREHVSSGKNCLLVSSKSESENGRVVVEPDYDEFARVLEWIVARPKSLDDLRKHTHVGIEERKKEFRRGWDAILPRQH